MWAGLHLERKTSPPWWPLFGWGSMLFDVLLEVPFPEEFLCCFPASCIESVSLCGAQIEISGGRNVGGAYENGAGLGVGRGYVYLGEES